VARGAPVASTALAWQAKNESPLVRGFLETARRAAREFTVDLRGIKSRAAGRSYTDS
jgi:hypothetical protein